MPALNLDISNVITINVQQPPVGLANYNVNTLALFTMETPVNSITNYAVYLSAAAVGLDWGVGSEAFAQASAIFAQQPNVLENGGRLIIVPMSAGQTLSQIWAIVSPQVFIGGVIYGGYQPVDAEIEAFATLIQGVSPPRLFFAATSNTSAVAGGGLITTITAAKETQTRGLLYTLGVSQARLMASAYASSLMSVDFSGSNTAANMNLRQLIGILPDTGISQTLLASCQTAGADVYANIAGRPSIYSSGANDFSDNVYNLGWFVGALQIAGFNCLAEAGTKIPQTESGISQIKKAFANVCQQAVTVGFLAPGTWTSTYTFGDQATFLLNILQQGFYIYSVPVAKQNAADRAARKAPSISIAAKYAGAVDTVAVNVYTNP